MPNADLYEGRVRWTPCRNTTTETIPPYACMQLVGIDRKTGGEALGQYDENGRSYFYTAQNVDGELVWQVGKCSAEAEASHDPSRFVFNDRFPIPPWPHGFGHCTADFPCQALHRIAPSEGNAAANLLDSLVSGRLCGPRADSWYVYLTGLLENETSQVVGTPMFSVLSHDPTFAYNQRDAHTIWITRAGVQQFKGFASAGGTPTSIGSGEWIGSLFNVDHEHMTGGPPFYIRYEGTYLFGFSGTVGAFGSANRGTKLSIQAYVARPRSLSSQPLYLDIVETPFECHRYHTTELIGTGVEYATDLENVAMTFPLRLQAGQVVLLKNRSSCAIMIENMVSWGAWIGDYPWRVRGVNNRVGGRWVPTA